MAVLSIFEFIDIIIMIACIGYIFSGYFARFSRPHDAYDYGRQRFSWKSFLFSVYVVGPAIILHEFGHKLVATLFGYDATLYGAISLNKIIHGLPFLDFASFLMILALLSTYFGAGGFLFFVPAYVSFSAAVTPFQGFMIAFAGPAVNLALWLGAAWLLKNRKISHKHLPLAYLTKQINMFLFIFNMIPIPGFDGSKVISGLFGLF